MWGFNNSRGKQLANLPPIAVANVKKADCTVISSI